MKIKDLVAELSKFDSEMEVCVQGYEYGYQSIEPDDITLMGLALNVQERGVGGEHAEHSEYDVTHEGKKSVTCLVIGR